MKRIIIAVLFATFCLLAFAQGIIFAWGNNDAGQLNAPVGEDFTMISAGEKFGVALRSDGSIVAWGANTYGQATAPSGNNYVSVSAGHSHGIALKSDGSLVGWGRNHYGQTNVPSGNNFTKINAGQNHNIALRADGSLVAWGNNDQNQCVVPSGTYIDVAAGDVFSAAVRSDGTLACWSTTASDLNIPPTGNDYVKVSAKSHHAIALRSNGELVVWGNDWHNSHEVPAGFTYADVDAGKWHNLAITSDGDLKVWGTLMWAYRFQVVVPPGTVGLDFAMVAAGETFSLALTGTMETDIDGDGVVDGVDEYPNDPLRAFNNYYPGPGEWGTLAFEDMWPQKGDYDFNDLVVDYRLNLVIDGTNKIKDIKADLRLRAVGATFQNAFAVEMPFPVSQIESVNGTGAGAPYNMPLIEAGAHSILKVISNTNDFVNVPGFDTFWNTQLEQPFYDPIPLSFTITLSTPFDPNTAPDWGVLNPYLMVNRVLGHEIHLPGYPPTIHVDSSLFGMDDDTTDPASGRYYKTISNLPWALDIPISWKYPIEKKQITQAYLAFKPWAESGGNQYLNWYEMIPAQINPDNIYDR